MIHFLRFNFGTIEEYLSEMVSNIWIAAADNDISLVESYLNSGNFSPNSKDANGYTPVHAAASYGNIDLLKLLISRGGDINIQDEEGDTPLHHVEAVNVAKLLVEELKADWERKNHDGQTAAEYIEENNDGESLDVVHYLKSISDRSNQSEESRAVGNSNSLDAMPTEFDYRFDYKTESQPENIEYNAQEAERRKKLEEILASDNAEEQLRSFLKDAVSEGLNDMQTQSREVDNEQEKKKKRWS